MAEEALPGSRRAATPKDRDRRGRRGVVGPAPSRLGRGPRNQFLWTPPWQTPGRRTGRCRRRRCRRPAAWRTRPGPWGTCGCTSPPTGGPPGTRRPAGPSRRHRTPAAGGGGRGHAGGGVRRVGDRSHGGCPVTRGQVGGVVKGRRFDVQHTRRKNRDHSGRVLQFETLETFTLVRFTAGQTHKR